MSVIKGTMRNADIIPAFLAELKRLDLARAKVVLRRLPQGVDLSDPSSKWFGTHDADDFAWGTLVPALNALAPVGKRFGIGPKGGADFGFWTV